MLHAVAGVSLRGWIELKRKTGKAASTTAPATSERGRQIEFAGGEVGQPDGGERREQRDRKGAGRPAEQVRGAGELQRQPGRIGGRERGRVAAAGEKARRQEVHRDRGGARAELRRNAHVQLQTAGGKEARGVEITGGVRAAGDDDGRAPEQPGVEREQEATGPEGPARARGGRTGGCSCGHDRAGDYSNVSTRIITGGRLHHRRGGRSSRAPAAWWRWARRES
jgi:hypothetical protein